MVLETSLGHQFPGQTKRIIICANLLPIKLTKSSDSDAWECEFDETLLFEKGGMYIEIREQLRSQGYEVELVGSPPCFVPEDQRFIVEEVLRRIHCHPVWLNRKTANRYYQGYCRTVLSPIFHNVIDVYGKIVPLKAKKNEQPATSEHDSGSEVWMPKKSFSVIGAVSCWKDYGEVNQLFSAKVVEVAHEDDVLWVNDYHLLLLPGVMRRKLPNLSISFFLHIPFPSSECFRILAHREEILRAMLCADHIGFHLYEYSRHFLTCCKRMLGCKCEPQKDAVVEVSYQHRGIRVASTHIGINPTKLRESMKTLLPNVSNVSAHCKELLGVKNKFVLLSISELESLSGVVPRLLAFERFLDLHRSSQLKPHKFVVFKQIGLTPDSRPHNYEYTRKEVQHLVQRINKKYHKQVVMFEQRDRLSHNERLMLYGAADVLMATPIRGKLDLSPFEFQVVKEAKPGCVIVSEYTTSFRMLAGVIKVNPYNLDVFSIAIAETVNMRRYERQARNSRDVATIERRTTREWCSRVMYDISEASKVNKSQSAGAETFGLGFGLNFAGNASRDEKKSRFKILNATDFLDDYTNAEARLLLFDYSGTLVETTKVDMYTKSGGEARTWHYENGGSKRPSGCLETRDVLTEDVKASLRKLAADKKNTVVVVSADLREELEHALEGIDNLVLVAENGFVFRMAGDTNWEAVIDESDSGVWYSNPGHSSARSLNTDGNYDTSTSEKSGCKESRLANMCPADSPLFDGKWQDELMELMTHYTLTTNGSFCWKAPSAVSFNFVLSDPEWGNLAAECLFLQLEEKLAGLPLSVEKGKGYVTVRIAGVNRGASTAVLLKRINRELNLKKGPKATDEVDFVWCTGDDIEDEVNFGTVLKYHHTTAKDCKIYNTRIGYPRKSSKARSYLDEPKDLWNVLDKLVSLNNTELESTKDKKDRFSFEQAESMTLAASHFITKKSLLNLTDLKRAKSLSSVKSLDTVDDTSPSSPRGDESGKASPREGKLRTSSISASEDKRTAWGTVDKITDSWSFNAGGETKKASGLKYISETDSSKSIQAKLKKNVSFKDLPRYMPEEGEQRDSPNRFVGRSSPDLGQMDRVDEEEAENSEASTQRRSSVVIPHSPSYIATPEESLQLFGPSQPSAAILAQTRLNDNQFDIGVSDLRCIPPTRSQTDMNLSHNIAANTNTNESENSKGGGEAGRSKAAPNQGAGGSGGRNAGAHDEFNSPMLVKLLVFGSAMYLLGGLSASLIRR